MQEMWTGGEILVPYTLSVPSLVWAWNRDLQLYVLTADRYQVGRILLIFRIKSLFIIGWRVVNMNFLASKIGAIQVGHKKQNGCFLEDISIDFDYILLIYTDHLCK
jgi:hypothetical protein